MANTKITASLLDPAQTSITSLGTLSALTISGNLTVDTSTLKVDSSNNRVGVGTASPQALFHAAATNTTVWPFTSAQSGTYSYTPYPHELVVDNDTTGNEGSFASVFFSAGADSDGSKIATARIGAVETGNYKADLVFGTRNTSFQERMRIAAGGNVGIGVNSPGAILSLPAGESNTPRFAIESAVDDNDFTITQYEDGNGTYTLLGQNVKLNSGGNNTVLDSAHRTAGIVLDARNHGAITFITGAANTATEHVKIDSSGRVGIHETSPDYNLHISNASQVGLRIDGSGSGYVQGSILLSSAASGSNAYRGHGIFYWNNESQTEWFLGAPYTDSDRFVINRKASQSSADFSSAYIHASHGQNFLTVENDGKVGINEAYPQNTLHVEGQTRLAKTSTNSHALNAATALEIRGDAIGSGVVDVDYFKGFKIALNDQTEWGSQAQFSVGRWQEDGNNSRSSLVISLGNAQQNSTSNADTDVMIYRSDGRVGIREMSPAAPLHIKHTSTNQTQGIRIFNSQSGGYGSAVEFESTGDQQQVAARVLVNGENNWGDVTSIDSTMYLQTINNNVLADRIRLYASGYTAIKGTVAPWTHNTYDLGSSSYRWSVVYGVTSNFSSDRNLKEDIQPSDLGLSFINKLTPVSYKWKDGTDDKKTQYGLIAQDVKTVLDEIGKTEEQFGAYKKVEKEDLGDRSVATNSTKNSTKSGDVDLGLAYEQFISPLIKAVQELSAEVESLKEKLNG